MKYFFPNELICCSGITGSLDMCILKFKKTWFFKFNFLLYEILGNRYKISFFEFSELFFTSYFQIYQEPLDRIVHGPHYGIIVESSKCWENKKWAHL